MERSDSITKLAEAFAKAQAEFPIIEFDAYNKFAGYSYATLGAMIKATKPILAKHGLSIVQFPQSEGNKVGTQTMLLHISGEYLLSDAILMEVVSEKGKSFAQVSGSHVSYARKYSLSAILGIYADEDADATNQAPVDASAKTQNKSENEPKNDDKPKKSGNKYARPMSPEVLKEALQAKAAKANPATDKQTNLVRVLLLEHFAGRDDERHQAQEYLTGSKSFSDIEPKMISAILDWMKPVKSTDGSGAYVLDKDAKTELTMVARQFMEDLGQQTLAI